MFYKPDFEELKPYYQAFWNCEVLDRVAISIIAPKEVQIHPESSRNWLKPKSVFQDNPGARGSWGLSRRKK